MCDFKENDEVVVTNFKYIYPDYNWLSVGMHGFIEKKKFLLTINVELKDI